MPQPPPSPSAATSIPLILEDREHYILKYSEPYLASMHYVAGKILSEDGFSDGYIGFQDGIVAEVGDGDVPSAVARGIVVPTFVNSHTHLADFIVPINLSLSLEEMVAPPTGLKHRVLESVPRRIQAAGMKRLLDFMRRRGVGRFIDFREGGIEGAETLSSVRREFPSAFIMGRPRCMKFEEEEATALLQEVEGVGVSGIAEWDYDELLSLAEFVHRKGKMFALHASEKKNEDIDKILQLKPSFLVHMTVASDDDLRACAAEKVPIVSCPRSNFFFGMTPPLARMLKLGIQLSLGTDNAMVTMPDILSEMDFAARLLRQQNMAELDCVLRMAIHNGRKILNQTHTIAMKPGIRCDFTVIESKNGDPVTDLVLRSGSEDPLLVCDGQRIWKGRKWSTSARS